MNLLLLLILLLCPQMKPSYPTIPTANISQEFGHLGHVGTDFYVPVDTDVYADLSGIIIQELDDDRVYGRCLMILHADGFVTLYGHLSEFKVNKWAYVTSGQLIALSGGDPNDKIDGDGMSSGPHLHWEVRPKGHTDTNKYNVNPMDYLISFLTQRTYKATVDSDIGLNVHSSPQKDSVVLYALSNKEIVEVVEVRLGWAKLKSVRDEWVLTKYLTWIDKIDLHNAEVEKY